MADYKIPTIEQVLALTFIKGDGTSTSRTSSVEGTDIHCAFCEKKLDSNWVDGSGWVTTCDCEKAQEEIERFCTIDKLKKTIDELELKIRSDAYNASRYHQLQAVESYYKHQLTKFPDLYDQASQ